MATKPSASQQNQLAQAKQRELLGKANFPNAIPMILKIIGTTQAASIPTLVLLVNPATLEMNYAKKVTQTQTRGGFVEEHWGEELDRITASGTTLGWFQIQQTKDSQTGSRKVLTSGDARSATAAYQNFTSLLDVYKNNASVYSSGGFVLNKTAGVTKGIVTEFGFVNMVFDNGNYMGAFQSFNYRETGDKPFTFDYDFEFTVYRTLLSLSRAVGKV